MFHVEHFTDKVFYDPAMAAASARTSSSLLAQLVQKRTALWLSSTRHWYAKAYLSFQLSSTASGITGNIWLVLLLEKCL